MKAFKAVYTIPAHTVDGHKFPTYSRPVTVYGVDPKSAMHNYLLNQTRQLRALQIPCSPNIKLYS